MSNKKFIKNQKSIKVGKKPHKRSATNNDITSSQFRWINQLLYTTDSQSSEIMFKKDPKLFEIYHNGYGEQIKQWPENPLDAIMGRIKNNKDLIIADMGCGKARMATELNDYNVHSFDLVAANNNVTACDIKNVPLEPSSIDIVVFCLSLMGTNLSDFINEANRILKMNGSLLIAEVASRFENVPAFTSSLNQFGFKLILNKNVSSHFLLFEFKKVKQPTLKKGLKITLLPCLYKKR